MNFDLSCRRENSVDSSALLELNTIFCDQLKIAGVGFRLSEGAYPNVLFDPRSLPVRGTQPLEGEDAVRILKAAGITADATGAEVALCLAPLFGESSREIMVKDLAAVIVDLLSGAETFIEWAPGRTRGRGKTKWEALRHSRRRLEALGGSFERTAHKAILLSGPTARLAADQIVMDSVIDLKQGEARKTSMLLPDGTALCEAVVSCVTDAPERQRFALLPPADVRDEVLFYLHALCNRVIVLRENDPAAGIDGPPELSLGTDAAGKRALLLFRQNPPAVFPVGTKAADLPHAPAALERPFFIGQEALGSAPSLPHYEYVPAAAPLRRTVLFEAHKSLGGKMVPFAGWEMPVQYPSGIFAEHRATRTAAGLFDVSHMSVFDFRGPHALPFLESVLAGRVSGLPVGRAAYSCLLYPDGVAMDDAYVYRLGPERFMLVVNAANAAEDFAWIRAAASGGYCVDPKNPGRRLYGGAAVRDLRDAGGDSLLDLALQGPKSLDVLLLLAASEKDRETLRSLDRNGLAWVELAPARVLVARTGYTGEPIGYELFVHPEKTVDLWNEVLRAGGPLGVLPAGLGARDAARLEAGLPLFGHELEGTRKGTLTQIGYGWVPKLHAPWFIGRDAYRERLGEKPKRKMVRLAGQGAKSARDGHLILENGEAVGVITSFAYLDEAKNFMALAFVPEGFDAAPGRKVVAARIKEPPKPGDDLAGKTVELTVLRRFPDKAEKDVWRKRYGS